MRRTMRPRCAGSPIYGPHSAKVPAAYTVISPGGKVWYACDTDCLRRHLDAMQEAAAQADLRSMRMIR
jgi:hypothetical protein